MANAKSWQCASCKAPNPGSRNACYACGVAASASTAVQPGAPKAKAAAHAGMASSDIVKAACAVIGILVAVAVVYWYIQSNSGHEVGHAEQPPGSAMKVQAMKAMKANDGAPPADSQAGDPKAGGGKGDPMSMGDK